MGGVSSHSSGPSVHHGSEQCPRRCPVQAQPDSGLRVDVKYGSLQGPPAPLAGHDRSLCHLSHSPLTSLFSSFPRSSNSGDGCTSPQLGPSPGVCVSSMGLDSSGPSEAPILVRRPDDPDCSVLASTSLVPGPSGYGIGSSDRPALLSRSSQTAALPSSSSRGPQAVTSCMETIQRFARAAGFSASVAAQVGLARHPSSRTSYHFKWSVFRDWYRREGHSISRPSLPKVANFLFWLRRLKGLSVSSILGYRSVLSAVFRCTLPSISSDPVLRDLIRSFKVEAPPRPLRLPAWDLSLVLRCLTSPMFEPLHLSSLRNLTKKVLFLVALATAKRVGEVQDGVLC